MIAAEIKITMCDKSAALVVARKAFYYVFSHEHISLA